MGLELSPELLLSAPLDNLCSTDAMGMLVGAAKLAPSGVTSALFTMTGIPELGRPELLSTTGMLEQLETPCLSGWPESSDPLLGVVLWYCQATRV